MDHTWKLINKRFRIEQKFVLRVFLVYYRIYYFSPVCIVVAYVPHYTDVVLIKINKRRSILKKQYISESYLKVLFAESLPADWEVLYENQHNTETAKTQWRCHYSLTLQLILISTNFYNILMIKFVNASKHLHYLHMIIVSSEKEQLKISKKNTSQFHYQYLNSEE